MGLWEHKGLTGKSSGKVGIVDRIV